MIIYLFIYVNITDVLITLASCHMSTEHQNNTVIDCVTDSLTGIILWDLLQIISEYDDCEERKFVNCNCCVRHNIGKPTHRHGIYISRSSGLSDLEKDCDHICKCHCRTILRRHSVDVFDCLYDILPYDLINSITQYVDVDVDNQ
jgi:hypothetical protein